MAGPVDTPALSALHQELSRASRNHPSDLERVSNESSSQEARMDTSNCRFAGTSWPSGTAVDEPREGDWAHELLRLPGLETEL